MMRQAIVSGGTGFIGSFLVKELLKKNIQTIVLGRKKFDDIDFRKIQFFENVNCHYINLNMDKLKVVKSLEMIKSFLLEIKKEL